MFQDDQLLTIQTVREAVTFHANLRLPIPSSEKKTRVEQVLKLFGLQHIANSLIGVPGNGISGGERKRVCIACEVVAAPPLLFLDEPTSGLDSTSAYYVIQALRQMAQRGQTIVLSVHQPSSQMYYQFDNSIMMSQGTIVYAGPVSDAIPYFQSRGYSCPNNYNPADYMMDVIVDSALKGVTMELHPSQTIAQQLDSASTQQPTSSAHSTIIPNQSSNLFKHQLLPFATSFAYQFYILCKRGFVTFFRNFGLAPAHTLSAIVLGLLLGGIFFQVSYTLEGAQNRSGVLFFILFLLGFLAMTSLDFCMLE